MTKLEIKTVLLLAGIYLSRMLGLFLIFPTFSLLAQDLPNATPAKIGLALGIYSLAQAVLQIPAGWLSDIIGRKKVLYLGLSLFLIGSVLAACSQHIDSLIVARLLQGTGAVSAVCLAYVGDSIRDREQGKAMMIIGMAIGSAFMLAFILGATISHYWGLSGLFITTAGLAAMALWFVYLLPSAPQNKAYFSWQTFKGIITHRQLVAINLQVALLHLTLSASFFLLPLLIGAIGTTKTVWLYTLPLIVTAIIVAPLVRNRDQSLARLPYFWLVLGLALAGFASLPIFTQPLGFIVIMTVFFTGFTLVETLLPACLFRHADASARGTTSGIFSLYQLSGNFIGGILGAKCYTIFVGSGTIQSAFYVLAVPVIITATVSFFLNKQPKR